jgi:hypothetical protein
VRRFPGIRLVSPGSNRSGSAIAQARDILVRA